MLKFFNSLYNSVTGDLSNILESDDWVSLSHLIKNKGIADSTYLNGVHILYKTCVRDAFKCLIWLLKTGADPDLVSEKPEWTPLRYAVENNLKSVAFLLVIHGANPDKGKPSFEYATPRTMATSTMKKVIHEAEQFYQSLLSLKTEYENLKIQADTAYKQPDMEKAKKLYQAAAEKYSDISVLWENLSKQETNEVFKSYYQEQQKHYLKGVVKLTSIVNSEIYIKQTNNVKNTNSSSQIRQRKTYHQKQQLITEEQPNQHKLVM